MPSYLIKWMDSFGEVHKKTIVGTEEAKLFKFKRELAGNYRVVMIEIRGGFMECVA